MKSIFNKYFDLFLVYYSTEMITVYMENSSILSYLFFLALYVIAFAFYSLVKRKFVKIGLYDFLSPVFIFIYFDAFFKVIYRSVDHLFLQSLKCICFYFYVDYSYDYFILRLVFFYFVIFLPIRHLKMNNFMWVIFGVFLFNFLDYFDVFLSVYFSYFH